MCGIAGAIGFLDARIVAATRRASEAIAHRGPDAEGQWIGGRLPEAGVVFCHRRLAILDLRPESNQPMIEPVTGLAVVFNGEIYNFAEIRADLEQHGIEFRTNCDTEVILHAFLIWGKDCVARFRGMFAFALYDPRAGRVHLVRDRLGIKPLYTAKIEGSSGKTLLFASEVRALLATGVIDRKANPTGIHSFLWNGFVSGPETIIRGITRIDPGTWLEIDTSTLATETTRYWRIPACGENLTSSAEVLRGELEEASRIHLVADVPLGVFLSGGVDSSAVSALAAKSSGPGLRTFNISFDEAQFDESSYARQVASNLGTVHSELRLSQGVFRAQLDAALACLDQPTFDAINTYFVSRAVREAGITVALAGTGGDELFGGYATFVDLPRMRRAARFARWAPQAVQRGAGQLATRLAYGTAGAVRPQVRWAKLHPMLSYTGWLELYQLSYAIFVPDFYRELALSDPSADTYFGLPIQRAQSLAKSMQHEPGRHAISQLELACFLGDRLLPDTDAASMAVALEVRVPLLDHKVVEAASQLTLLRRFAPLRKKQLLRELALDELPPEIFDRPKSGFELPIGDWCRQELGVRVAGVLCDSERCRNAGLNADAVRRLWRAFEQGAPGLYWSRVWSLFVLLDWMERQGVEL